MKSSYRIALSAVSASFAVILLTLGAFVEAIDISCVMFAGIAMMIPLTKKDLFGAFMSYLAAGILALILTGMRFTVIVPYAFFFGLYPIINAVQDKYLHKKRIFSFFALIVKDLWFLFSMYVYYKVLVVFSGYDLFQDFSMIPAEYQNYIVPCLCVFGAVFFVLYDFVMKRLQRVADYTVARIIKK